ncbi:MAG: hypothetical protein HQM13_23675 [SAR324 cluster bacterium]|nr:hypothetical protein [SAR324 cluster bacterium]
MKRTVKYLTIAAAALSLTVGGLVMAHGWSDSPRNGNGNWQGRGYGQHQGQMGQGNGTYHWGMGQGNAQFHRGMGQGYGNAHHGMGPGNGQGRGMWQGSSEFQRGTGPGALLRTEMNDARVEVLAELSGKSVKEIQEQVKTKPFRMLLGEFQVNFEEFQAKMHAKVVTLVDQAAKSGKITDEQAKSIYLRMNSMGQNYANSPDENSGSDK